MFGLKSLAVIVAVASVAAVSTAQAGGTHGHKHVKHPAMVASEGVRGSHAEMPQAAPAWSYQGTRGLSSPGGRG